MGANGAGSKPLSASRLSSARPPRMEDGLYASQDSADVVYTSVIAHDSLDVARPFEYNFPLVFGGGVFIVAARMFYEKRRGGSRLVRIDGSTPLLEDQADALPIEVSAPNDARQSLEGLTELLPKETRCLDSPDTVMLPPERIIERVQPFSWAFGTPAPFKSVELRAVAAAEMRRFFGLFWQLASAGALQVGSNWYVRSKQPGAAYGFEPHLDPDNVALSGALIARYLTRKCAEQVLVNNRSLADEALCGSIGVGVKLCTRLETIEEMRAVSRVAVQTVFGAAAPHDAMRCVRRQRQCEFMVLSQVPTSSCAFCNPVDLFDARLERKCRGKIESHDAALCHSFATVLTVALLLVYESCDMEHILHAEPHDRRVVVFFEAVCAVVRLSVSKGTARRALTLRKSSASHTASIALRHAAPYVEESFKMCSLMLRIHDNDRIVRLCQQATLMHAAAKLSR